LESLKKTIPLNGLLYSHHLRFLRKTESNTIRVVTDLGIAELILLLKHHPFPIPKIGETDMIRSMKGFTFASALDLNMGYYHIKLDADSGKLKIQIQTLTHGYQNFLVPDVFQTSCQNVSKIWNMLIPILMIC
jgi:hypothetical protein